MLFTAEEIGQLRSAVAGASSQVVADISIDPIALLRSGASLFRHAQLLCHPDGRIVAGMGTAWAATGSGPGRFASLQARASANPAGAAPIFTGFAFSSEGPRVDEWRGFHSSEAVVPQVAVWRDPSGTKLVLSAADATSLEQLVDVLASLPDPEDVVPFEPGDHSVVADPPSADWRAEVDEAVAAIKAGSLEKVVLSRSLIVTTELAPQPFDLVEHLRATYPQCHVFVWQAGDAALVGASPELLLEKERNRIRVNPLAGSARRGEGEADDRAVGEALMHSVKDRNEHALVVNDIASRLEEIVSSLEVPTLPSLRRMATVQHLSSEIVGLVEARTHPLQLVDLLHPTPAVGGTPRTEALAFVDKLEGIDRGWYTGGIGWFTADGDATFAIPLRCALVRGQTSHLFAGAGVVAESRAADELDETRLKFRPMLSLLTAT